MGMQIDRGKMPMSLVEDIKFKEPVGSLGWRCKFGNHPYEAYTRDQSYHIL